MSSSQTLARAGSALLLAALVPAGVPAATGCDLCAVYSAIRARGELGNGPFAGVAEQFTHYGTLFNEGNEVPNPADQVLNSSITQVFVGMNVHERFAVQFNLPVIDRWYRRPDGMGGIENGSLAGLGDATLLANVVPWRLSNPDQTITWSILAGVKFPTGQTSRLQEELHEMQNPVGPPSAIHGHDLTLGSGSYDGLIGSSLYSRWGRMFDTAQIQFAIRSTGDYGYRFANDLTWAWAPGYYVILQDAYTVGLQVVLSGEAKGKDELQGVDVEDTGYRSVYFGPQVAFTWREHLSATFGADFPVFINNTGLQIVPDYRVRAAVNWHF